MRIEIGWSDLLSKFFYLFQSVSSGWVISNSGFPNALLTSTSMVVISPDSAGRAEKSGSADVLIFRDISHIVASGK